MSFNIHNIVFCEASVAFLSLINEIRKNPLPLIDSLRFMYPTGPRQPVTEREMRKGQ